LPHCPNCGKEVAPDFKVCPYCSYDLNIPVHAQPAPSAPSAQAPISQPPPSKKSNTGIIVGVVLLLLLVVFIVGIALQNSYSNTPVSLPVSGHVTTSGFGTSPYQISFTGTRVANQAGVDSNGNYAVTLQVYHGSITNFQVTIFYHNAVGQAGSCFAGTWGASADIGSVSGVDFRC
jgi:RNA polymerase subunit RPABC4/transcription elongation factor Spt4